MRGDLRRTPSSTTGRAAPPAAGPPEDAGRGRGAAAGGLPLSGLWPWLTLAGLGAFHGINPAMGWLFAVALGLHRRRRAVVLAALLPIALGHALAVAVVALAVVLLGLVVDQRAVRIAAGLLLIGWALCHTLYGARHRPRFGMQVGLLGLGAWSFLMATSHGAGLMLVPVLIPLCLAAAPAQELTRRLAAGRARRGRRPQPRDARHHRHDRGRGLRVVRAGVPAPRLDQSRSGCGSRPC